MRLLLFDFFCNLNGLINLQESLGPHFKITRRPGPITAYGGQNDFKPESSGQGPFCLVLGCYSYPWAQGTSFVFLLALSFYDPFSSCFREHACQCVLSICEQEGQSKVKYIWTEFFCLISFPCTHILNRNLSSIFAFVQADRNHSIQLEYLLSNSMVHGDTPGIIETHIHSSCKVFCFSFSVVNPHSPTHVSTLVSFLEESKYHDCHRLPASEAE